AAQSVMQLFRRQWMGLAYRTTPARLLMTAKSRQTFCKRYPHRESPSQPLVGLRAQEFVQFPTDGDHPRVLVLHPQPALRRALLAADDGPARLREVHIPSGYSHGVAEPRPAAPPHNGRDLAGRGWRRVRFARLGVGGVGEYESNPAPAN